MDVNWFIPLNNQNILQAYILNIQSFLTDVIIVNGIDSRWMISHIDKFNK
jgi:hypothetical protein